MATKAERFKYEAQRAGASGKKSTTRRKTKQKIGAAAHGSAKARNAVFAFEETPPKVPPSRKSTRRSMHHQKSATALTGRNLLTKSSPRNRHDVGPPRLRAPR
jgi:hypothetical protein